MSSVPRWRGLGLIVGLGAALAACSGTSSDDEACLAGSRICAGDVVMLCTVQAKDFVSEYTCPQTMTCLAGGCVPRLFEGDGGDETPAPAPHAADDVGEMDPGDAALADAGPPDVAGPGPDEISAPEPDEISVPEPDEASAPGPDELSAPEPDEISAPEPDEISAPEPDEISTPEPVDPADHGPTPEAEADVPLAQDDAGPVADHGAPPVEVPFTSWTHIPTYEPIGNIWVKGDLHRVRWHPSGGYAIIAAPGGELLRYDVSSGWLTAPATVPGDVADLEVAPEGGFFLAAGSVDDAGKLWRITPGPDGALDVTEEETFTSGVATCVVADPAGTDFAVGTWKKLSSGFVDTIHLWRDGPGIATTAAFNGPGLTDLMWADPGLFAGSAAIVTGEGLNGAGSHTYVLASDMTVGNGWSPGFGNPGGAGWRPGGSYGILTGWSSNKLYVFDGSWTLATLPGVPTGGSPNAIGWKPDGTRALVVGRAVGSPLAATVVDYRPLDTTGWQPSALLEVSIEDFSAPPWSGNSNVHLRDVDWRPGTACDEGLIVGSDTGTSLSPSFGTVIRFMDPDDPWCGPAN